MSKKLSRTYVLVIVLILVVLVTLVAFFSGYDYVRLQDSRLKNLQSDIELVAESKQGQLINADTPGAIEVVIPRGADSGDIAKELKDKGLISNVLMFKILSKVNGFDDKYKAGKHYLTNDLSYDEMMMLLSARPKPIKITIVEGMTYKQIQKKLIEAGLNISVDRMDAMVQRPNQFLEYDFVKDLVSSKNRNWLLQGYLWPDTYEFDDNMDEEDILRVFLNRTEEILSANDQYQARAEALGMSMDKVLTMASLVQAESDFSQMSQIARVFFNRLDLDWPLQSCASINFLREEDGKEPIPWAQEGDLERYKNNPYNTYSNPGLPPGPINNPGTSAIEAVLWPATERSWSGASSYLYFCADGKGKNVFASTLEEQEENIRKYEGSWQQH